MHADIITLVMADVFESILVFLGKCDLRKTCSVLRVELIEVGKRIQDDLQELEVARRSIFIQACLPRRF